MQLIFTWQYPRPPYAHAKNQQDPAAARRVSSISFFSHTMSKKNSGEVTTSEHACLHASCSVTYYSWHARDVRTYVRSRYCHCGLIFLVSSSFCLIRLIYLSTMVYRHVCANKPKLSAYSTLLLALHSTGNCCS